MHALLPAAIAAGAAALAAAFVIFYSWRRRARAERPRITIPLRPSEDLMRDAAVALHGLRHPSRYARHMQIVYRDVFIMPVYFEKIERGGSAAASVTVQADAKFELAGIAATHNVKIMMTDYSIGRQIFSQPVSANLLLQLPERHTFEPLSVIQVVAIARDLETDGDIAGVQIALIGAKVFRPTST